MVLRILFTIVLFWVISVTPGQNYTSYFTGNPQDYITNPSGGICLMGGAMEDDNAMKWFLQRANGGDILVLRTSGSNGYNSYMYNLGVAVNSVETIVFNNASASWEPYIHDKIQKAEAIWFAGGDQWMYITYWRNTPIDSLINKAIAERNIAIGGISAGMAILGDYYFTAQYGTVTSSTALSNPYNYRVTVDSAAFIKHPLMKNVITDTHFDNPDRKGRLTAFLARIYKDYNKLAQGIACDEYTAVCIDTNGTARVFGSYPSYDDNAYFVRSNCELPVQGPETCQPGIPLTWYHDGLAIKTYVIKGTKTGNNSFDMNTWLSGVGGSWYNWHVMNGLFGEEPGYAPICGPTGFHIKPSSGNSFVIYPTPANNILTIKTDGINFMADNAIIINSTGQRTSLKIVRDEGDNLSLNLAGLPSGFYLLLINDPQGTTYGVRFQKQ